MSEQIIRRIKKRNKNQQLVVKVKLISNIVINENRYTIFAKY